MYPLVTIGIPTYNRADSYLRQALESAVKQTYQNIEIVVSDNCSSDDTETLVKNFEDPRIRYFKQTENIGAYKNFNFCLQQANGTYFLILSDDDLIDNDFIDVCMKAANYSTDIGIIRTGTRIIDSQGGVVHTYTNDAAGLSTEEFFRGWFVSKTAFYPCSSLFNHLRVYSPPLAA
jgi:glycosyltransferase involved in cell wall biosynthesis